MNQQKILLIDDDRFLLDMYELKLKDAGFTVAKRQNCAGDFIGDIINTAPDLISLDIVMPPPDGFNACAMLKADPRTRDIPVFFLDNLGQQEDIDKGLSLGAVGYVIKAEATPSEVANIYVTYLKDPQNFAKVKMRGLHLPNS